MLMYWRELSVSWGESDPFGLVYYPRMLSWFNDTEHDLFRTLGFPTEELITKHRTAFVMGEVHFRFIGPAAYGQRIKNIIFLSHLGKTTLHWKTKAIVADTGALVCEGTAIRVYAKINEDGTLSSLPIPDNIRKALTETANLEHLTPSERFHLKEVPNPEAFTTMGSDD